MNIYYRSNLCVNLNGAVYQVVCTSPVHNVFRVRKIPPFWKLATAPDLRRNAMWELCNRARKRATPATNILGLHVCFNRIVHRRFPLNFASSSGSLLYCNSQFTSAKGIEGTCSCRVTRRARTEIGETYHLLW